MRIMSTNTDDQRPVALIKALQKPVAELQRLAEGLEWIGLEQAVSERLKRKAAVLRNLTPVDMADEKALIVAADELQTAAEALPLQIVPGERSERTRRLDNVS